MSNTQSMYSLRGIRRVFGAREVLHIDTLDLQPGKIYGLLGPNGAGKSTLMRLLAFLDSPSQGELFFYGERVQPRDYGRHRARVVWVPQSPVMFTGSLLYNIEYPMALKKVERDTRRRQAHELLDMVNLAHLASAPAQRLSGGEAQRASIARALAAGAQVILFDEPTANVDHHSRSGLVSLMRRIWQQRDMSLVVTTHDAALADDLCHEQIVLMDGQLVPQELLPGGIRCWKARLECGGGLTRIVLPPEAERCIRPGCAIPHDAGRVISLTHRAEGVHLRFILPDTSTHECVLHDEDSCLRARALHLDSELCVAVEPALNE